MRYILALALVLLPTLAWGQATVVPTCGVPPAAYDIGSTRGITQDPTGKLCTNAASSAATSWTQLGFQQITALTSATNLTAPAGTNMALICAEGASVRWRDDGTPPTATIGMPVSAGQCFNYMGTFATIQFIQVTATASLDVSYYR